MEQNQQSEFSYLFNSLDLYRAKYLRLLNEDSSKEELDYCEKAIRFYLSALGMLSNVHKPAHHFVSSIKAFFMRLMVVTKPKPTYETLHSI